jgi:hypothetical protein
VIRKILKPLCHTENEVLIVNFACTAVVRRVKASQEPQRSHLILKYLFGLIDADHCNGLGKGICQHWSSLDIQQFEQQFPLNGLNSSANVI